MLEQVIEYLVGSIFLSLFFIFSGKLFFNSSRPKPFNLIVVLIGFMIFITFNYMSLENIARLVTMYAFVMFIYKLLYRETIFKCAISALISYFLLVICEVIFIIILTILFESGIISNIEQYAGTALANFFICSLAFLFSLLIRKFVNFIMVKIKEHYKLSLVFTFILIITAISSAFFKMNVNNWEFDYTYLLNIVIIFCLVYIGVIIIKQHLESARLGEDYEKYLQYSKQTEKLVEQYSISQHENKNELIIIKSMVHKNNKKLLEYLNEIISSKDSIVNSWIKGLKYIPFGGLKGIMHNKISLMKDRGLNVFLNISKDVGNSHLKDLNMKENNQLSKIIGVFLDNATEASLLSVEKDVSVSVYMSDKKVVFEISNSFVEKIDIDKIYENGHSTKGKNRGYGLVLVKNILEENKRFENEVKITNNYFSQILKVKK